MRLDDILNGKPASPPPLWFMRQAGRYLPEYRALRAANSDFISYCLDAEAAATATLQPINRYNLDAAIIFSDILMIPWAMQRSVEFIEGEGPRMTPLNSPDEIKTINHEKILILLAPIFEAVKLTRTRLAPDINLIGFCGSPWTVATYMIEGARGDFEKPRRWLWESPAAMQNFLNMLADISIDYLAAKINAGADTIMLFDSWAGAVPAEYFQSAIIAPTRRIIDGLRARNITAPIIGFAKDSGANIIPYAFETGITAIGLDHTTDPVWAHKSLPPNMPVQGNLDPAALLAGDDAMLIAADRILDAFASRPHIFNLGHGISRHTPPENLATLIDHIRK